MSSCWQESIDVLLTGAWKMCKAFVPHILEGARGGSIVLTASSNGFTPQPSALAYGAAKAGVLNMMRVLAGELGEHDVRVNAICPGGVDTLVVTGGGTLEAAVANALLWAVFRRVPRCDRRTAAGRRGVDDLLNRPGTSI